MFDPIEKSMMGNIAEIFKAIAILLWPIITFIVILIFKNDLKHLIGRIKKGKLFGNEIELEETIKEFEETVERAEAKLPFQEKDEIRSDNIAIDIIKESSTDPKIGLIRLAIEIERQLKELMYTTGWFQNLKRFSVQESFEYLTTNGVMPTNILSSLKIFWNIRSKIIHGSSTVNTDEIIRVIDIGLILLNAINSIPRAIHNIYKANIDIYHDSECTRIVEFGKGIILEATSPGKTLKSRYIYPTTKTDYTEGKRVTWEWSFDNVWAECYYVNPDSGEKVIAWSQSAEFIGRHIELI